MKVREEMASLKRALHDTSHERDRALQNLSRLKQHLLDKVTIQAFLLVPIPAIQPPNKM